MTVHPTLAACIALTVAASCVPIAAQGATGGVGPGETFRPLRPSRRGPAPPPVTFQELGRIELPSPAAGGRIAVEADGRISVLLRDGWVVVGPETGSVPERVEARPPGADAVDPTAWVAAGARGKRRVRIDPDGGLRAERRSALGGADGYRVCWRLRLTGRVAGPPLVHRKRLYVGSSDNRVYALRLRTGHRLWVRDLESRISRPLAMWAGTVTVPASDPPKDVELAVILAVPDDGRRLLALDPYDGSTLGEFVPAGDQERLISGAAVLDDGTIAVLRRGWRDDDVALALLRLEATAKRPSSGRSRPSEPPASR